ncbi:MAG: hypothetical protein LBL59_03065 [Xanthomonadaceae bacterium]|jgi:predicted N-formylglutamate amidohydrolase|nr:hypothetical protein [Xanthomonadaceae bacterium]
MPSALDNLGLPDAEIHRHIGWNIGIASVARLRTTELDAVTILQTYSRLVITCGPHSPRTREAIPGFCFPRRALRDQ